MGFFAKSIDSRLPIIGDAVDFKKVELNSKTNVGYILLSQPMLLLIKNIGAFHPPFDTANNSGILGATALICALSPFSRLQLKNRLKQT